MRHVARAPNHEITLQLFSFDVCLDISLSLLVLVKLYGALPVQSKSTCKHKLGHTSQCSHTPSMSTPVRRFNSSKNNNKFLAKGQYLELNAWPKTHKFENIRSGMHTSVSIRSLKPLFFATPRARLSNSMPSSSSIWFDDRTCFPTKSTNHKHYLWLFLAYWYQPKAKYTPWFVRREHKYS